MTCCQLIGLGAALAEPATILTGAQAALIGSSPGCRTRGSIVPRQVNGGGVVVGGQKLLSEREKLATLIRNERAHQTIAEVAARGRG